MMKNITNAKLPVVLFVLMVISVVSACKKESSPVGTGKAIEFVALKAEKDTIVVQEVTKVKATVMGEGLTYSWKCDNELGVIEGSGSEILFTICHTGKFRITCDVRDSNNNQATKDTYVTTIE